MPPMLQLEVQVQGPLRTGLSVTKARVQSDEFTIISMLMHTPLAPIECMRQVDKPAGACAIADHTWLSLRFFATAAGIWVRPSHPLAGRMLRPPRAQRAKPLTPPPCPPSALRPGPRGCLCTHTHQSSYVFQHARPANGRARHHLRAQLLGDAVQCPLGDMARLLLADLGLHMGGGGAAPTTGRRRMVKQGAQAQGHWQEDEAGATRRHPNGRGLCHLPTSARAASARAARLCVRVPCWAKGMRRVAATPGLPSPCPPPPRPPPSPQALPRARTCSL